MKLTPEFYAELQRLEALPGGLLKRDINDPQVQKLRVTAGEHRLSTSARTKQKKSPTIFKDGV